MSTRFASKTYGRIFISKEADREVVIDGIMFIDAFEMVYLPKDCICVLGVNDKPMLKYTHKFEIDIDALMLYCWRRGVRIWCVTGEREEWSCS